MISIQVNVKVLTVVSIILSYVDHHSVVLLDKVFFPLDIITSNSTSTQTLFLLLFSFSFLLSYFLLWILWFFLFSIFYQFMDFQRLSFLLFIIIMNLIQSFYAFPFQSLIHMRNLEKWRWFFLILYSNSASTNSILNLFVLWIQRFFLITHHEDDNSMIKMLWASCIQFAFTNSFAKN